MRAVSRTAASKRKRPFIVFCIPFPPLSVPAQGIPRPCEIAFAVPFTLRMIRPPPVGAGGLLHRPNLVQRIAFEQLTILHHVSNTGRIPDVLKGILRQDDEVSQLSGFDTSEVLSQPDGFCPVESRRSQSFQIAHSTG